MPKRRAAQNCKVLGWLSAKPDCREGRFLQLGNSLLLSPAFHSLKPGAQMLYLSLAMESGLSQEVYFSRSSAAKYGIKHSSYDNYVKELIAKGFVKIIFEPGAQYEKTLFRFTSEWKTSGKAL